MRYTAALSIRALIPICRVTPELPSAQQTDLAFMVYDMTNDDDDDIRNIGAEAATQMNFGLSSQNHRGQVPVPRVAGQMLCVYIFKSQDSSRDAASEALRRLVGSSPGQHERFRPIKELLDKVSNQRDALFGVEKPNLYIDPVREAKVWSRVLKIVQPHYLEQEVLSDLTQWCIDSLERLRARSQGETDGPLGWTSKPEVFALGMRVIYATEVLLKWRSKSRSIPSKGFAIRNQLFDLYKVGVKIEIHPLWLQEIGKILKSEFIKKTEQAASLVHAMCCEEP